MTVKIYCIQHNGEERRKIELKGTSLNGEMDLNKNFESKFSKNRLRFEFSGKHYLTKKEIRKIFNWDEDSVCDLCVGLIENPFLDGQLIKMVDEKKEHFKTLADQEAHYNDKTFLFLKKAILDFYLDQTSLKQYADLFELEARDWEKKIDNFKNDGRYGT